MNNGEIALVPEPASLAVLGALCSSQLHPAFPTLIHESPSVPLVAVRASNAIAAVTVPIAAVALRARSCRCAGRSRG